MASNEHTGLVGYTGFVHPAAAIRTRRFSIGGASLIEPFVSLEGDSAQKVLPATCRTTTGCSTFPAQGGRRPAT